MKPTLKEDKELAKVIRDALASSKNELGALVKVLQFLETRAKEQGQKRKPFNLHDLVATVPKSLDLTKPIEQVIHDLLQLKLAVAEGRMADETYEVHMDLFKKRK